MRILALFVITWSFTLSISAQLQHNHWFMGFNAALDFTGGSPTPLAGALSTDEGCTSIADSSGQLLFFTNGETVWDANQDVMPNGSGLLGHFSSSQSALIVPVPDQAQQYYIFTAPAGAGQWTPTDLGHYHQVDMSQNNGLGDVVTKNMPLAGPLTEKLTATKHANGVDTWVVYHGWDSDAYYAYLVTCSGIEGPVVSNIGYYMGPDALGNSSHISVCMKLNRQGTKLASVWTDPTLSTQQVYESRTIVDVLDFNNSTGELTNLLSDTMGTGTDLQKAYGVEFSPNGALFYISDNGIFNGIFDSKVFQYNLNDNDPMASEVQIASGSPAYGSIQLGPDGALYIARLNGATYLSRIEQPNVVGAGCGFVNAGVSLGVGVSTWGLPNHWDTYQTPPPIDPIAMSDTTICSGTVILNATYQHPFEAPTYLWSTGETTASIEVDSPGIYTVEVMLACSSLFDTVHVDFGGALVDLGPDRSACTGTPVDLMVQGNGAQILWSNGDTTEQVQVFEAGIYSVQLTDSLGCASMDSVLVQTRNCECPLYLPNAFSPDGDGNNELFGVSMDCDPTDFELVIFDRWGTELFRTANANESWNGGTHPLGVYAYRLRYDWLGEVHPVREEKRGHVLLLR